MPLNQTNRFSTWRIGFSAWGWMLYISNVLRMKDYNFPAVVYMHMLSSFPLFINESCEATRSEVPQEENCIASLPCGFPTAGPARWDPLSEIFWIPYLPIGWNFRTGCQKAADKHNPKATYSLWREEQENSDFFSLGLILDSFGWMCSKRTVGIRLKQLLQSEMQMAWLVLTNVCKMYWNIQPLLMHLSPSDTDWASWSH